MTFKYNKEGRIAIFTFNRPEARNAMNIETYRKLQESMVDFRDDPNLLVGIITGVGEKAFCAGADIMEASLIGAATTAVAVSKMGNMPVDINEVGDYLKQCYK